MKKILIIVFLLLFVPIVVNADSFKIVNTDLSIELENDWEIFTRENIENNSSLEKYNVTYEYMNNFFNENKKIYADIVKMTDDFFIELLVAKEQVNGVTNLSLYSEEELNEFVEEVAKERDTDDYSIYDNGKYKFGYVHYYNGTTYVEEYITVVNNDKYTFYFREFVDFSGTEKKEIKKIMNSVVFDVKTNKKGNDKVVESVKGDGFSSIIKNTIIGALIGGSVGALCGFVYYSIKKKNMDKRISDNENDNNKNS